MTLSILYINLYRSSARTQACLGLEILPCFPPFCLVNLRLRALTFIQGKGLLSGTLESRPESGLSFRVHEGGACPINACAAG